MTPKLTSAQLSKLAPQLVEAVLSAEHIIADPERARAKGTFNHHAVIVYAAADAIRAAKKESHND